MGRHHGYGTVHRVPDELLARRPLLHKRLNTVGSRVLLSVLHLTLEVFESTTLQAIGFPLQNTVFQPSDDQNTGGGDGGFIQIVPLQAVEYRCFGIFFLIPVRR